jgi:protein-tyrosine phosphatase
VPHLHRPFQLELTGNASYLNSENMIETTTWGPKVKHSSADVNMARFDSLPPNTNFTLKLSTVTRIKRPGEPVFQYFVTAPSIPPKDALQGIRWIRVRESHGRWMFKLYVPRVTERFGAICCYRFTFMLQFSTYVPYRVFFLEFSS